jgi:hypothetical protein
VRAAACVAVVVAAALLSGCGGESRREAVDDYLEQVDRAQTRLLAQKGQIDLALGRFDLGDAKVSDIAILRRAERELERTAAKVRALEPPREARRLHVDVLRLLDLQAGIAHDLGWAARYVPRYRAALEPLGDATARLRDDLRAAHSARASGAAFAAYRTSVSSILRDLRPLDAPPPLRASLAGQRRALERSVTLSTAIEEALGRGDVSGLSEALRSLSTLSSGPQAVRTRQAEIAAAKAYNRRLAEIGKLSTTVEQDRRALDASLD